MDTVKVSKHGREREHSEVLCYSHVAPPLSIHPPLLCERVRSQVLSSASCLLLARIMMSLLVMSQTELTSHPRNKTVKETLQLNRFGVG